MVSFIPLNIQDEESVNYVLSSVDNAMQYGEDLEPKVFTIKQVSVNAFAPINVLIVFVSKNSIAGT